MLRERAPKLAELMDEAREDVLAYTAFPKGALAADRQHQSARAPQRRSQTPLQCRRSFPMIVPSFGWSAR